MRIRIASRRDGFRRCGIAHSGTPTVYPGDRFTKKELDQLKADPMLLVDELPDEEPPKAKKGGASAGGEQPPAA